MRIGLDVGGTFTDCVLLSPDGTFVLEKTPTTPDDQSEGVLAGIARLAEAAGFADAQPRCSRRRRRSCTAPPPATTR